MLLYILGVYMLKSRSATPPGVACNLARAARVGFHNGTWFALGLTLTVPTPAVYAHASEALVYGRLQVTCDPPHMLGQSSGVA